jgi:uncharacterized membrane protein (UPF0127 family)
MTRRLLVLLFLLLPPALAVHATKSGIEPLEAFPRSKLVIEAKSGALSFDVWVADTPPRRSQGLMYVKKLERGTGMLFMYGEPQVITMWMKNTLIPLDMLFVARDGRITRIARNASPRSLDTISSLGMVSAVIELGGGEASRLGIEPGDRVVHAAFAAR